MNKHTKSFSDKPVSVIMIAYNEEDTIKKVIIEYFQEIFLKLPKRSEFILYLDNPTDSTPQIVKKIAKKLPLRIVKGKHNLKYARALKKALKLANNDIIFYSDSSGKHAAKDFWELYKYCNTYDIVNGLRSNRKDPLIRQLTSFFQKHLISILFSIPAYDFNTGYKIINRNVLEYVIPISNSVKYTISSEFLIRALKKGFSIKEIPVSFVSRKNKLSGTKISSLFKMSLDSVLGYIKIYHDTKRTT